jgi:hypothetical protein
LGAVYLLKINNCKFKEFFIMITNEQTNAAIKQHTTEAEALEALADNIRGGVTDLIRKQDGKQISKRLYLPLCAAAGLKAEQGWKGATFYRSADWKADIYGHTYGAPSSFYISGVRVKIGERGAFQDLPLIPSKDSDKLDAAATVAQLEKIAAACDVWAKKERYAAEKTEYAAAEYNKIQSAAVELIRKLDRDMLDAFPGHHHGSISVLCGFGSKYHSKISALEWEA